jgi:hypothetical protein
MVKPVRNIGWGPAGYIPGGPGINLGESGTRLSGFGPPQGLVSEILQAFLLLLASALQLLPRLEFFLPPFLAFLDFQPSFLFEISNRY